MQMDQKARGLLGPRLETKIGNSIARVIEKAHQANLDFGGGSLSSKSMSNDTKEVCLSVLRDPGVAMGSAETDETSAHNCNVTEKLIERKLTQRLYEAWWWEFSKRKEFLEEEPRWEALEEGWMGVARVECVCHPTVLSDIESHAVSEKLNLRQVAVELASYGF